MRHPLVQLALLLLLAAVTTAPLLAGGGHHTNCEKSAQECLNAKAAAYAQHGWLGVETEGREAGGYTVAAVTADSPAAEAGLQPGDVLLAMNGVALKKENKAELKKIKRGFAVGTQVTYVVLRGDSKKKVTATLGEVPRPVLARWVGQHMLEHHVQDLVAQVD